MESLKIVSMNVNGLNMDAKRRIIFDHLRQSKADIIFLQETHATSTIERIWEKEWGGAAFFNNGSRSSRGVAILMSRKLSFNVCAINADEDGRALCMDIEIDDVTYTLGSLYAPTQDRGSQQLEFIESIDSMLTESHPTNIILGGDLNHCMDPFLDRSTHTQTPNSENMGQKLASFQEEWNICDIWRIRNPNSRGYTFRRASYASRLDHFLISTHLSDTTQSTDIKMTPHSDHAMISITLGDSDSARGPGLWRLDTSLLGNEAYVTEMNTFLENWVPPPELASPHSVWEWLKHEIQTFTNKFTRKIYSQEKQHIADLNRELKKLYSDMDEGEEDRSMDVDSVRRELREIEESRARKIIFRAKCNWSLAGERPTKYFLNLEKRRTKEKTLHALIAENGTILTRPEDILNEGKSYYSNLYHNREDQLLPMTEVQESLEQLDIPRLSEEDKETLEAPFTEEEFRRALGDLNSGKTPGSDGLPPEFYTTFWQFLAPFLCASLGYAIETGIMSDNQKRGIITLVPKKGVDRRFVSNWRPITLLNSDYKVYSKALALRLQGVMGLLIHENQTGFMSGRLIGDSVRAAEDSLEIIKEDNPDGMLVALDFAKAFDSVRWSLIFHTLEAFNFGESFVEYVKVLFIGIQSCLYNNGRTSSYFSPGRGIRQGCCVSPSIFLLVVELLAIIIRKNHNIQGISLRNSQLKIVQFADDATCFLASSDSLPHLLNALTSFASWSGLGINKSKTKIISPSLLSEGTTNFQGMSVVSKTKILGIWVGLNNNETNIYDWNFKDPLVKIRGVCDSWVHRNLSLKARPLDIYYLPI